MKSSRVSIISLHIIRHLSSEGKVQIRNPGAVVESQTKAVSQGALEQIRETTKVSKIITLNTLSALSKSMSIITILTM